ncbi:hypothetical protein BVER_01813 [Candidatus Burkholderia verschuerenii]|uniref:Uncharacterized protein n=1 Tax=Candidatus Burkholderia verschuerenii TaxID=242163 RepID=A0A0L0MJ72_9BURK|nr:hypothetical protein [Candidatus Burkholderia verschuerenii]KND62341.1 hypothetical protein BVER_01813 [Candidatus Burkholderia verschuerenii]
MFRTRHLKWEICQCCAGNGHVEHPAFSNGITSSEWAEMSSDEQDTYMRGGYDVMCEPCSGAGKVQVPDVSCMAFGEKREYVLYLREREADARAAREIAAEVAAERRMGC